MPSTTPERLARWGSDEQVAIDFLKSAGYKLTKQWSWISPEQHIMSDKESDAILYLIQEWDFDGIAAGSFDDEPG